jgi:phospho-N-acetylmuramoyl-pentapeptide-transferase
MAFSIYTCRGLSAADDILQIITSRRHALSGGIDLATRLIVVAGIALVGALWFYYKLDWRTVYVPGLGDLFIGMWYIPFFVVTMIATFSGSVIDGIDGLSGGVLASAFAAYAGIAFFQNQVDVSAFAAALVGALLAFLWFNIPPARFWMGETGIIGLTTTLTVIAFFTDSVLILPLIAFPLVLAAGSDIIQVTARRFWGKKIFRVAPIQHHFEAIGWPSYKVTMRFWVISVACAIIGIALALVGR